MRYRPYMRYKAVSAAWMDRVPEHWAVEPVRMKYLLRNGYSFDSGRFAPEGTASERLVRIRDLSPVDSYVYTDEPCPPTAIVSDGDVLVGMDGDFNAVIWTDGPAKLNQRVCALRGADADSTRFLLYALPTPLKIINDTAYSTTVKHLSSGEVLSEKVPIPPQPELRSIVAHLDRATARIDALIEKKTRFIELLREKRRAVIVRAATKGFGVGVTMKNSGVEWIGDVPEHWVVSRLGHFATVENGTTPSRENDSFWAEGTVPWLGSGEVNQKFVTEATAFITDLALRSCSLRLLPMETVVVGMIGQGKTRGLAAILKIDATINQNLAAIRPGPCLLPNYLLHVLEAAYEWVREAGRGSNQAALNCEILSEFRLALPPTAEQEAILEHVSRTLNVMEALGRKTEQSVSLLKERRAALITAAVTGQIDVRAEVPAEALA